MKKNHQKSPRKSAGEKTVDAVELNQEVAEEFRETTDILEPGQTDTTQNCSQPEDRGEDLINETDPFIQQPEKDTQIPPELIQQRAYHLYEQRGDASGNNLADWFEAERQLRREVPG
jgi:hypothetical protein